jgi:NADP-dependent 3-hydroxy acid dehydrogenase YdfG
VRLATLRHRLTREHRSRGSDAGDLGADAAATSSVARLVFLDPARFSAAPSDPARGVGRPLRVVRRGIRGVAVPRLRSWYPVRMKRTIIVCGHGPGISDAVARRFGADGHPVAIVARNAERLTAAAASLVADGIKAQAFPCDLGDTDAVRKLVADVRAALGPIGALHWNAYRGGAGDLLAAGSVEELRAVLDVSVHGLVAAVQAALPDLQAEKGAVLVTGGGFAFYDPKVDAMATQWGAMGLAIGKAAQHKAVGLLHQKLAPLGVYVGEVVVLGMVKGTAFDAGNATLEATAVADRLFDLHQRRSEATVNIT